MQRSRGQIAGFAGVAIMMVLAPATPTVAPSVTPAASVTPSLALPN